MPGVLSVVSDATGVQNIQPIWAQIDVRAWVDLLTWLLALFSPPACSKEKMNNCVMYCWSLWFFVFAIFCSAPIFVVSPEIHMVVLGVTPHLLALV